MEKAFQEEGIACIKVGGGLWSHMACLGDYQEFAVLQYYWRPRYEQPEINHAGLGGNWHFSAT